VIRREIKKKYVISYMESTKLKVKNRNDLRDVCDAGMGLDSFCS